MKTDFDDIARASQLALVRACRRLRKGECEGEAARAWNMGSLWKDRVQLLLVNNAAICRQNSAFRVVRSAGTWLAAEILKVELANRRKAQERF